MWNGECFVVWLPWLVFLQFRRMPPPSVCVAALCDSSLGHGVWTAAEKEGGRGVPNSDKGQY